MDVDYLIIGQGLAGTLLVHEFMQAGKSCYVIDNPNQQKASEVAAGMINPVVFRRLTKSWLIDELYPQLLKTYAKLEKQLDIKLYYPLQIKKVFGKDEADFWQKQTIENELKSYLLPTTDREKSEFIKNDFGIGTVKQSGRVDLKLLIHSMQTTLKKKQLIRFEKLNFDELILAETGVRYQDIEAKKIIFCEGHGVSQNPFFKDLRFRHTKGEVLRIKTNHYNSNFILNKAIFLMPEGNQYYRLGATYDWKDLSENKTEKAKNELQEKLSNVFSDTYQVVDHQVGIRPTTHDRRPVIGIHPTHRQIGIFNGLGSKGTMLGPYFARQFCDYLNDPANSLHPEVSIERYF